MGSVAVDLDSRLARRLDVVDIRRGLGFASLDPDLNFVVRGASPLVVLGDSRCHNWAGRVEEGMRVCFEVAVGRCFVVDVVVRLGRDCRLAVVDAVTGDFVGRKEEAVVHMAGFGRIAGHRLV